MLFNRRLTGEHAAFHPHGPLPPEAAHLYVLRPADARLEQLIREQKTVAVIGPRLSGKSSMLLRQWGLLGASARWSPAYIALGELPRADEATWRAALYAQLAQQTGLAWPPDRPFHEALRAALAGSPPGNKPVLLLDEIESVPPAWRADFFASLRAAALPAPSPPSPRRSSPDLPTIVLAGCTLPDELIADAGRSPFRVAEPVYVTDASLEALTYLVAQLATDTRHIASDVPERVFEWTEGDVHLAHALCAALERAVPRGALLLDDVDRAVRQRLFAGEGAQHFERLWAEIEADPDVSRLLDTLLDHREPVRFTLLQRPVMRAWLMGAIRADANGNCALRSLAHDSVFFALRRNTARAVPRPRLPLSGTPGEGAPLLGRYRLDHVIHPGRTSYVFRGTDLHTGEMVAIKQLTVSRDVDEIAWQRFQREAEALKRLDHPGIVRLRDAFRDADFEYIVMEYVYGGSLFDRLNREGRLPLRAAVGIAAQLAGALDHAHARGIVHRDVKPSNIMLTPDGVPRLADFGVARLLAVSGVTRPRTRIGTTPYLSPEACLGDPIGAPGDLWSLGIVLYEMLAGMPPFGGRTDAQIAHAILESPLPDLRAIRPDAPDALIALLRELLAKRPAERIASARLVEERLRAI